jgi:hypothetical protein
MWWHKTKFRTSRDEISELQRMASLVVTEATRTAPMAAIEVLLGLPPLHLQMEAEARAGIYRLYWKPKSEDFGRAYMTHCMNPSYRWILTE